MRSGPAPTPADSRPSIARSPAPRRHPFGVRPLFFVSLLLGAAAPVAAEPPVFERGLPTDPAWFPIAVWLQSPANAARYRDAGINLYVGLWKGPTATQLDELDRAGMKVICDQNRYALEHLDRRTIVAWMHGDEPDNAQSLGEGRGYGPPILPEVIVRDYQRIRTADPSRPVLLNLGQGVAWDNYIGRGVRRNHPEDYPRYLEGCDIASFDIYPVVHDSPEVTGRLEFVARGVERLVKWTEGRKTVWNCIECTRIGNPSRKATPDQVRSEVWMALIRGSRGLIYFVHQFQPTFREAALLDDPEMLAAVTAINRQIRELAPVLHRPNITTGLTVSSDSPDAPIAWMQKRQGDEVHLFTVNLGNRTSRGSFRWSDPVSAPRAEVLGESRQVALTDAGFTDDFGPYQVHLYRLGPGARR